MTKVYAALPVLNEPEHIKRVIDELIDQEGVKTGIVICVNQPSEWWGMTDKQEVCMNNLETLEYISSLHNPRITCIDKSSPGNGWIGRKHGVGWARKTAMDIANEMADDEDIILSVDADTYYPPRYFKSVIDSFDRNPQAVGFSSPYYHLLTGDETADRCILRYEIYMRNYSLNMLLIRNPYCFSAIGSGMACKARIYRKVRGLTPKMSGEDFYFIQKLRKLGPIIIDNEETIYPASRFSNRVYFGTGPAMIKGRTGDWSSYPIYDQSLFLLVKTTYDLFDQLYTKDIPTPMDACLMEEGATASIWEPLRQNCTNTVQFGKAASQKIDALRILQFLKISDKDHTDSAEGKLARFMIENFYPKKRIYELLEKLNFKEDTVATLNLVRDFMFVMERQLQQKYQTA